MIIVIDREGTIQDICLPIHLQIVSLTPTLQQTAKDQDNHAMTDNQNAFLSVISRERSQETLYPKSNIGTALSARGPIPILTFSFASCGLLCVLGLDSFRDESVQDAKFDLTDALLYYERRLVSQFRGDLF